MAAVTYPVRVDATLDPQVGRWLWLVKWLLAIPHYFLLIFLWVAFVTVSIVAFFAILFTGRYPRSLFEFNVGVLRWTWRVSYYTYGALGTDRYPPFSLAEDPDYPAHLDVAYPEHLSRGLVLVKWWLLAIPHYLVVGIFAGGGTWAAWRYADHTGGAGAGGLIGLLVLIAAVVLMVTGRYPEQIFDFVLGMNRWVLRVASYAALMTDEYPPFRLDMGGADPAGTLTLPPAASPSGVDGVEGSGTAPAVPPPAPTGRRGWTAGRIVSLVAGCMIGLMSFGLLAAGGVATWATNSQRDSAGYVTTGSHHITTPTYAVTSDEIDFGGWTGPVTPADIFGTVRVRATAADPTQAVFVGVAPKAAVDVYLAGVSHEVVTNWSPFTIGFRATTGAAPTGAPADVRIWSAQTSGAGTQALTWRPASGNWVIVVMNANGSPGVDVTVDAGATVPDLAWVAVGLFIAGGLLLGAAVVLVVVPVVRASR